TLAVKLRPKTILVGFYFGNDLVDVYNAVRFNKNWSSYADLGGSQVEGAPFILPRDSGKFLGTLRDWLSRNSVLYAFVTQRSIFNSIREREFAAMAGDSADSLISYRDAVPQGMFNFDPPLPVLATPYHRIKTTIKSNEHRRT